MKKLLFTILLVALAGGILVYVDGYADFISRFYTPRLTSETLQESLQVGKKFLVRNQTEAGDFVYNYDFVEDEIPRGESEVRQAGALWGLSVMRNYVPDEEVALALEKGVDFFEERSRSNKHGRYVVYDSTGRYGKTGTQALFLLAYLEFLKSIQDSMDIRYHGEGVLDHARFLLSLQMPDLHFYGTYRTDNGSGKGGPSPYSDGETLLALLKVARHFQLDSLRERLVSTAYRMHEDFVVKAREAEDDSDITKGFYQWGSMSFFEIFEAGWDSTFADKTIEMAHWMIDVHRTLSRTKNTAYAHEGMIVATQMARATGDEAAVRKFEYVIDQGLSKLISWQVRGPMENDYLLSFEEIPEQAHGGVMNSNDDPVLRIDVTQHQMHALILADKYIY